MDSFRLNYGQRIKRYEKKRSIVKLSRSIDRIFCSCHGSRYDSRRADKGPGPGITPLRSPLDSGIMTIAMKKTKQLAGRRRVVIDRVSPCINGGAFPVKRIVGETVHLEADILADGHDLVRAVLRYRPRGRRSWRESALDPVGNDLWTGTFSVDAIGFWEYSIRAWIDHGRTWQAGLRKKHDAAVATEVDLQIGGALVEATARRAGDSRRAGDARQAREAGRSGGGRSGGSDARELDALAKLLVDPKLPLDQRIAAALDPEAIRRMDRYPDLENATELEEPLQVWVDRERAGFSAWYELFPRSAGVVADGAGRPDRHGTFRDVMDRLPAIARMGFDILYLPPIHPIGTTKRKGRNNVTMAGPTDPGSPWAIGGEDGGHTAIHPSLGSEEDFRALVERAHSFQMEIALDIAFQCSPDHPWVREHPQWFVRRPDGSIQYAENPPKKYEDIYPISFETEDWQALWEALRDVFLHWVARGVRVFRVDNPHTKSFPFWDWAIAEIHRADPHVIFLAEAFTRPKRMYRLAKGGFTQSYTYFTWRNSPGELQQYLTELTEGEPREFFRPNFWPNTPDILHEDLQTGGRAAFVVRVVLAATLSSNYGMYGPAYELMESEAVRPGSEEYRNSEKYEIRAWDVDSERSIAPLIARINGIRRSNRALQSNRNLRFHATNNPNLLCYSKADDSGDNVIMVCVNMDYHTRQAGMVEFSPAAVGRDHRLPFVVRDLLGGHAWTWYDYWNYVELDPEGTPAHIFVLEH
jgi:starch synthase (maltosyl-transferring)